MKKLLSILLAGALLVTVCFGLTACGGKVVTGDTIVVGVTDYPPMDYLEDEKWVGFDAELAEVVFSNLGYKVEFKEIDWDTKMVTLNAGTIDVIWNGMTVTDDLLENVLLSNVYLNNQQYGVVKKENVGLYSSTSDLAGKTVGVESGSAANDALEDEECDLRKLTNQNSAIMEVAAGTVDIAVVDYTMAEKLTSEGSQYYGILEMVDLGFEVEEFAIAFRQSDSKLCWLVNREITELIKDGTVAELAEKYGIENLLII